MLPSCDQFGKDHLQHVPDLAAKYLYFWKGSTTVLHRFLILEPGERPLPGTLPPFTLLKPSHRTPRDSPPETTPGTVIEATLLTHDTAARSDARRPSRGHGMVALGTAERWGAPGLRGASLPTSLGPSRSASPHPLRDLSHPQPDSML